jgi:hypothetical protein
VYFDYCGREILILDKDGKLNNLNKPSSIHKDYSISYYLNSNLHRLDGPAYTQTWDFVDGKYYINGNKLSEVEYWNHPDVDKTKLLLFVKPEDIKQLTNQTQTRFYYDVEDLDIEVKLVNGGKQICFYKPGTNILHREVEFGAARIEPDSLEHYITNGKYNNLLGPAISYPRYGKKESKYELYYIDGKQLSRDQFYNHPLVDKVKKENYWNKKKKDNKNVLIDNAKQAFARVLSIKVSKAIKNSIIKLLDNHSKDEIKPIIKFLDSDVGDILVSGLIGMTLPNLSGILPDYVLDDDKYQLISEEFRVNALAIAETMLIDKSMIIAQHLIEPIVNSISTIPGVKETETFDNVRIQMTRLGTDDNNIVDLISNISNKETSK